MCIYEAIINSLGTETINSVLGFLILFLSNRILILSRWQFIQLWTVAPKGKFAVGFLGKYLPS